ncbi:MAG: phospholipase D-like domain-containing protein [Chlamydiae bacterium]|nr:phospholipase D-like domain-containing protein [Chlamydiota bacterium]
MQRLIFFVIIFFATPLFSSELEVYFSPEDHLAKKLVQLIEKEDKAIQVAIYCITHQEIIKALIHAKERGAQVEVIVDSFSFKNDFVMNQFVKAKIPIFVWNPPVIETKPGKFPQTPLMHDKFCIFGGKVVWTGSFNFTYRADQHNQENAIVLGDEGVAKKYLQKFLKMKKKECKSYKQCKSNHHSANFWNFEKKFLHFFFSPIGLILVHRGEKYG